MSSSNLNLAPDPAEVEELGSLKKVLYANARANITLDLEKKLSEALGKHWGLAETFRLEGLLEEVEELKKDNSSLETQNSAMKMMLERAWACMDTARKDIGSAKNKRTGNWNMLDTVEQRRAFKALGGQSVTTVSVLKAGDEVIIIKEGSPLNEEVVIFMGSLNGMAICESATKGPVHVEEKWLRIPKRKADSGTKRFEETEL